MIVQELRTLYQIALSPIRGATHKERLESFYAGQALEYDNFRKKLLHGRRELFDHICFPEDGIWLDMGGGTGQNLDFVAGKLPTLHKAYIVDLCPSLLAVAQNRITTAKLCNVEVVEADATTFVPTEGVADLITFSYSLTMIPDWFLALEHALKLLRPGGRIAIVDFYIARKYPAQNLSAHNAFTRRFWPMWFYNDNVFLNQDHLPWLLEHLEPIFLHESFASVPYIPFIKVPYYSFIGTKSKKS